MFMMVDYVREMAVKKFCRTNMDRLSICSSCYWYDSTGKIGERFRDHLLLSRPQTLELRFSSTVSESATFPLGHEGGRTLGTVMAWLRGPVCGTLGRLVVTGGASHREADRW